MKPRGPELPVTLQLAQIPAESTFEDVESLVRRVFDVECLGGSLLPGVAPAVARRGSLTVNLSDARRLLLHGDKLALVKSTMTISLDHSYRSIYLRLFRVPKKHIWGSIVKMFEPG